MTLTDQEQVVLKAIYHIGRNGIAPIASVIRAIGYPKATTKKLLAKMADKGIVALHRHDYPTSLLPAERKLLIRRQDGQGRWHYFSAVSARERNPMGKHLPGLSAKAQRQYEHILESAKKYHRYGKRKKEVAARTVRARQNPKEKKASKGKTALKKTGKALKGFARGALSAGAQILGAGATALNPHGMSEKAWKAEENKWRKSIAAYRSKGWTYKQIKDRLWLKFGLTLDKLEDESATFVPLFGRSGGFTLDLIPPLERRRIASKAKKANPRRKKNITVIKAKRVLIKRVCNPQKKKSPAGKIVKARAKKAAIKRRKRNASTIISTAKAAKRRSAVGRKNSRKAKAPRVRSVAKARKAATRRVAPKKSSRVERRRNGNRIWQVYGHNKTAKGAAQEFARTYWAEPRKITGFKPDGTFKVVRGLRTYRVFEDGDLWVVKVIDDPIMSQGRRNPSAESIRKTFAGSVSGSRDLFFPQGTPSGKLAKLGKLVSITTEKGTIKPVNGSAWLCADTKERLHIGSTTNAPLYSGPARSFGKVTKVEYEGSKPHLGYKGPIIWFHHMGEENGRRPTLHADGKGGLVFKGGQYRLTKRGIEN